MIIDMIMKRKSNLGTIKSYNKVTHLVVTLAMVVSMGFVMIPLASVGGATQTEEFTESDAFIVPAGVTEITVEAWGSGGAGGGSTSAGGGSARGGAGGGGGAYASSTLAVEPEQELQVVIGTGGAGVNGDNGNPGNPSFVGPDTDPNNAFVRATGGSGGIGNTAGGNPEGGVGGTVEDSIGQVRVAGHNGEEGATGKGCRSGAGGDGAYLGGGDGGAAATRGNQYGNPGEIPGGGGGGSRTQGNGGSRIGGAGAAGKIVISWATHDLTISSTDGGSVITPGEGTFAYVEEAIVDLVAESDDSYRFVEWTGDVGTIDDVYAPSTTITMNGDYSITAHFMVTYGLSISSTEGGSVTTPGEGSFTYDEGTVVDLTAEAEAGYQFFRWIRNVGSINDVYAAATNITMNGNHSITAKFVKQYGLSVSSTDGGSATTPGDGLFTYGEASVVGLAAEAEAGYQLVEWTGDVGTVADAYAASTTITMSGDYCITANFELVPLSVTTLAATNVTSYSSTLNMVYTVGDFSTVKVRFAYKKSLESAWSYTDWVSKSRSGTHTETLTGLNPNAEYDFVAQLNQNDIEIEGTTVQFATHTPSPSGGCFIATAAYGTPAAEQIDVLREFRDSVLLESTTGSIFVSLYYQFSPPVADFIAGNELLRTLVKEFLIDPIVCIVEATEDIWRN